MAISLQISTGKEQHEYLEKQEHREGERGEQQSAQTCGSANAEDQRANMRTWARGMDNKEENMVKGNNWRAKERS